MAQSLSYLLIHIIFSTKGRVPYLTQPTRSRLHAYVATITRNAGAECYRAGGTADHLHVAVQLPRTTTVAELVETLKTASSQWLKTQSIKGFSWQRGYAAFSVGPSDLDALTRYIDTQEAHHHKQTFEEELTAFLKKYAVEYDDRYLLD